MGAAQALISAAGQFAINPGTWIEHALGTAGRDAISGNAAANALDGADGSDTLEGRLDAALAVREQAQRRLEDTETDLEGWARGLRAEFQPALNRLNASAP